MSAYELFREALERAKNPSNPPSATLKPDNWPLSPPAQDGPQTHSFARLRPSADSAMGFMPAPPPNSPHDTIGEQWVANNMQSSGPCRNFIDPHLNEQMSYCPALRDQCSMSADTVSDFTIPGLGEAGEPPQSKTSDIDALFSDVDDMDVPDLEDLELGWPSGEQGSQPYQEGTQEVANGSHIAALEQHGDFILPMGANSARNTDKDTNHQSSTQNLYLMSGALPTKSIRTVSPTESVLAARGFEFHNKLSEEVQIESFGDKAFRKALREVNPELPRKQQWYAWNRVQQMLENNTTHSHSPLDVTPQAAQADPAEAQQTAQCERDMKDKPEIMHPRISCKPWPKSAPPPIKALNIKIDGDMPTSEQWSTQVQPPSPSWSFSQIPVSSFARRDLAITGAEETPGESKQEYISETRLPNHSEEYATAPSLEPDSPYMPPPRHGSPPDSPMSEFASSPIPAPPRPLQPSPIQRPDTPRPIDSSIRQSVEPETPRHLLHRESTPAFEARSPTPSPASHIETADIEMTEYTPPAPTTATPALALPTSSPDPISSPLHTVTAPETPMTGSRTHEVATHSQLLPRSPNSIPLSSPLKPAKQRSATTNRRKSTGVQGSSKINKTRNITQKFTTSARKVTEKIKKEGSKVAQAVAKIENTVRKQSQEKQYGNMDLTLTRRSSRIRSMRIEKEKKVGGLMLRKEGTLIADRTEDSRDKKTMDVMS